MSKYNDFYESVDEIKECIIKDLFGVSSDTEILTDIEPISTYVTGILYPQRKSEKNEDASAPEYDEDEVVANDVIIEDPLQSNDDTVIGANKYRPRTMGVSVMLPSLVATVSVVFECGKYEHIILEEKDEENQKIKKRHSFKRTPQKITATFNINSELGTEIQNDEEIGVSISFTVRKIMADGSKLVTVSAINTNILENKLFYRNESHLFQCKLSVKSEQSFVPIYQNPVPQEDIEGQIRDLMYRDVKNYAYGHGCSIAYNKTDGGVFEVCSEFIPNQYVFQMMPGDIAEKSVLSLIGWQTVDRNAAYNNLIRFINEYENWKLLQESSAKNLTPFKAATDELIRRINVCIRRLKTDELHLISGSLGSLAGIYEIAVKYLCRKSGTSPKIIASTATVKNAEEQIKNLYNKKCAQFPPGGISFDDSFFSRIAGKNERPARTYIGLCSRISVLMSFPKSYTVLFVKVLLVITSF